jgi:cardiolipin synthase
LCAKIPGSSVRDFYHNLDNNQGKEVILKAENNKILKEKKNWILLLFKKLAKLIFNRIFYVAVAMLVQLGWILMMVLRLAAYSRYIDIGLRLIGIVLVLWILNKEINPSYKLAWTMLILILPILGVVLYFVFGRSRIAAIMQQHFEQRIEESREYLRDRPQTRQKLEALDPSASNQSRYISDVSRFPVHENTTAEYFQVGDDMFPVLVRELKQAKKYIFIEYFIINDGVMWQTILNILEKKAAEGVDVRLIYDGFGCLTTLPHKYYEELQKKGIKCQVFNPFRPILNIIQNNRDHRKLCIIDGWVGFTGGINLADEYINQKERFGHWKDTAVMLKGEAVWNMTVMFLHMWAVIGRSEESVDYEAYFPHRYHEGEFESDGFVQPFCDTPLDEEVVGEDVYLNIINKAKKYVYICTPYLIIDNEMMTALCLAAKSGVDVRIMTPGIPDKKLVFILTQSYYRQLLEAGVKIYEYQPGFLHAKSFVSDDEIGVVGTINLDYRSLYLHFEDGVWIYRNRVIQDIKDDFIQTMEYCRQIELEFCLNRNIGLCIMQNIFRVFAPLM